MHEEFEPQPLFLVTYILDIHYFWLGIHRLDSKRILYLFHSHLARKYTVGVNLLLQYFATLVKSGEHRFQPFFE